VPEPYFAVGSLLAMEFIGDENGNAAPMLKETKLNEPNEMLNQILKQAALLYSVGLVHADLSEFNILVKDEKPYLIDIGQGVTLNHPEAGVFIRKDITNITHYFASKYNIRISVDDALKIVTKLP
jgi:RIO kinase 1